MFIVYVQSNQAIGSRSGGWSSSQILLKSISLGFTSSFTSLLFSLLSNWFSFLSEPSFLPLSVSRILRGGGTYPSFGRWTTRKPRNEISTKPGHSPTSKLPKRVSHTIFMDTVGPHCSSCSKWFLTLLTRAQPSMMLNHLWSEIFWPSSLWRQPGKQMKQCCDALEMWHIPDDNWG